MKNVIGLCVTALVVLVTIAVYAAQDTALENGYAEVRDPVKLKAWLEANATDAESRIATLEAGSTNVPLAALSTTLSTGTLTTNVVIDAVYTNTIILRTLDTGIVILQSWTQVAVE